MSIEQLTSEAMKLDSQERASLAEAIWESLGEPHIFFADLSDDQALSLASQRDKEIEEGKVSALSHAQLMERLV